MAKATSPEPVIRNYLSPLAIYQKERTNQGETLLKLSAAHAQSRANLLLPPKPTVLKKINDSPTVMEKEEQYSEIK